MSCMKMVEGRSEVTIIFSEIRVQETAQRSTMCLMPKVIKKMMILMSLGKKMRLQKFLCVQNPFFEQKSLDKNIKWCSSAHCHIQS